MTKTLTVGELFNAMQPDLKLRIVAGEKGMSNPVAVTGISRPGLLLAGYDEVFAGRRTQVIGLTELSFLDSLDEQHRKEGLTKLFSYEIPSVTITRNLEVPQDILALGNTRVVPILVTALESTRFISLMSMYLEEQFAPSCTIHGTMMEIFGMGVFLSGKSGVGKSECALELVKRGHRLIADDIVVLNCIGKDTINASAAESLGYHMEIRGIGIIDIKSLYGIGAVRKSQRVDMIIKLEHWDETKKYEREGLEQSLQTVLDIEVPEYTIPIVPGRNLSILVETAALHRRLITTGVVPAKELNKKIIRLMKKDCKDIDDMTS